MTGYVDVFLAKAEEALAGAESEFSNRRFNNCANRCYYACFQAAVAALIRAGIRPVQEQGRWGHAFVQGQFVGQLVNRQKVYPPAVRDVLQIGLALRQTADYEAERISETRALRLLRRARAFLGTIHGGGNTP